MFGLRIVIFTSLLTIARGEFKGTYDVGLHPNLVPLVDAVAPRRHGSSSVKITYAEREMKLIRYVLRSSKHDRRVRPVSGETVPVNVTIRMNLYQVVDVV